MEDISENLLDNEYCDCNFKYHEKCYEKWLVYNNIITINMERNNDYVDYRCILCKERILFDVKINEWMDETSEKFKELNNLKPEKFSKESMMILNTEYIIKILSILSLILSTEIKLFSPEKVRFVILKLNDLLEKIIINKNKKNRPPIH